MLRHRICIGRKAVPTNLTMTAISAVNIGTTKYRTKRHFINETVSRRHKGATSEMRGARIP